MLPGNLQYWQPCKFQVVDGPEIIGTKFMKIDEPIHFGGPSPGDQSTIAKEEKKEYPLTSTPKQP